MTYLVDKYKAIKFIEDYKENHNKEPQKYPINYGTLLDIIRWLYSMPTVEAVPLSVIEDIKAEIEELGIWHEKLLIETIDIKRVLEIIDRKVNEVTEHDT